MALTLCGVAAAFQPNHFGRVLAAYRRVFIGSLLWGCGSRRLSPRPRRPSRGGNLPPRRRRDHVRALTTPHEGHSQALDGHPDELESAGEASEGEGANVVAADAEGVEVGAALGRRERFGHGGQEVAESLADGVSLFGVVADGLAEEPDAIADVPGLVVVDLGVALTNPGSTCSRSRYAVTKLKVVRPSVDSRIRW